MTHSAAILGASGYTGAELVRLIATHPGIEVSALSGDRKAGMAMGEVFPHLGHLELPRLCTIDEIDFSAIDIAFCALPHAMSQSVIADLPKDGIGKIGRLVHRFTLEHPKQFTGRVRVLDLHVTLIP